MNRGRESDRRRPNPTSALSQRQREALALYATAPPGETLLRFCRRAGVHRDTWHGWRTSNPDFAGELARIRQERVHLALDPLQDAVPRLVQTLVRLAADGSLPALRLAGDWLGLTRRATEGVQLAITAAPVALPEPDREHTVEGMLALLQSSETERHRRIMLRYLPGLDLDWLKRQRDMFDAAVRRRESGEPDLEHLTPDLPDAAAPDAQSAP